MNFIATAWIIFTFVVGMKGVSFWWIPGLTIGWTIIYLFLRPTLIILAWQHGPVRTAEWLVGVYVTAGIGAGIVFFLGYGIGKLF
jgi:hypothetical protein